ncbi:MAG: acetate/propionate family kinase [Gammaproteobacteria bacterium]|nr:acetate/propionate family kinase [Gammaproteobacteria bacterium]
MRVLVVNCGSSSVKLRVLQFPNEPATWDAGQLSTVLEGAVKDIGGKADVEIHVPGQPPISARVPVPDHARAIECLFERLAHESGDSGREILAEGVDAAGHRVVHGGDRFSAPVLIDGGVAADIDALSELAPLHNPACLAGIHGARSALGPGIPMVAVFDTAFHQTMPDRAKRYALPAKLSERHGIRRYGFHGIAHASLLDGYLRASGKRREQSRVITLQLGNGCSIAAIDAGRSIDTSMGFTPLEGLVMGTRSGDLDPSIVSHLCEKESVDPAEVERWLNEDSGLLGLSGRTNDMRELLDAVTQEQHAPSKLAVDLFCYRAKKYVGAYLASLDGADAVIFGGGIGEAAPEIRNRICAGMDWCGVVLDPARNATAVGLLPGQAARISAEHATVDVYVVAADEESWIAQEAVRCLQETPKK